MHDSTLATINLDTAQPKKCRYSPEKIARIIKSRFDCFYAEYKAEQSKPPTERPTHYSEKGYKRPFKAEYHASILAICRNYSDAQRDKADDAMCSEIEKALLEAGYGLNICIRESSKWSD